METPLVEAPSTPALSPDDLEILARASEALFAHAEERDSSRARTRRGAFHAILDAEVLGPSLCDVKSVTWPLSPDERSEYRYAALKLQERAAFEARWDELGTGWLDPSDYTVFWTRDVPRDYLHNSAWIDRAVPGAGGVVVMSLPGIHPSAGLALLRFVLAPSAHGYDGVVLLELVDGRWTVRRIEAQHAY